jgi:hypothetical protein
MINLHHGTVVTGIIASTARLVSSVRDAVIISPNLFISDYILIT